MNEKEIYDKIDELIGSMGISLKGKKLTKFTGAMTTEVLREVFKGEGFNASERDSFIKGIPNELDLIILKKNIKPIFNSFYRPEDVLAVFEIKFSGLFDKGGALKIKEVFNKIKTMNSKIRLIYLTVSEMKNFKHKATKINLNADLVVEFFLPKNGRIAALKKGCFYDSATGDYEKLLRYLRSLR